MANLVNLKFLLVTDMFCLTLACDRRMNWELLSGIGTRFVFKMFITEQKCLITYIKVHNLSNYTHIHTPYRLTGQ